MEFSSYSNGSVSESDGGGFPPPPAFESTCFEGYQRGEYDGAYPFHFFPIDFLVETVLTSLLTYFSYVVKFYVSPLVALAGVLINASFLFVVAKVRNMRTVTNLYLSILAGFDVLFLTTSSIEILLSLSTTGTPGFTIHLPFTNNAGCILHALSTKVSFYGSICMGTLVTFERFMAICLPLKHRIIGGKTYSITVILTTTLVALLFGIPAAMAHVKSVTVCILWPHGFKERLAYPIGDVLTVCKQAGDNLSFLWFDISLFTQTSFFIINLILNLTFYISIIVRLGQRNVGAEGSQERQAEVNRIRNQVAKMLIINGTVFYILMLPFEFGTISNIYYTITESDLIDQRIVNEIQFIGTCLRFINSSINPIIYGLSNPRYRKAYAKAFGCGADAKGRASSFTAKTGVSVVSTRGDESKSFSDTRM